MCKIRTSSEHAVFVSFLPATSTRGQRVRATQNGASKTIAFDFQVELETNAVRAFSALAVTLPEEEWIQAPLMDGGFIFVRSK